MDLFKEYLTVELLQNRLNMLKKSLRVSRFILKLQIALVIWCFVFGTVFFIDGHIISALVQYSLLVVNAVFGTGNYKEVKKATGIITELENDIKSLKETL